MHVLVVGSGVIGLCTAIELLVGIYVRVKVEVSHLVKAAQRTSRDDLDEASRRYDRIICRRRSLYLVEPEEKVMTWARETFRRLVEFSTDPASGVHMDKMVQLYEDRQELFPRWATIVPGGRRSSESELLPGFVDGVTMEVPLIDTHKHMRFLREWFVTLGGVMVQREVRKFEECFGEFDIVCNCTGLFSRDLVGDDELTPIRGQVMVLSQTSPHPFTSCWGGHIGEGGLFYIIPHPAYIIVGGVSQEGNWNVDVDPMDTELIWEQAVALFPQLRSCAVLDVRVGLRPARTTVRVEAVRVGEKLLLHNYGHGGSGYTIGWGCAQDVVRLLNDATASRSSLSKL